jgi:hypothetical protein
MAYFKRRDTGSINRWRHNLSRAMKESAERRKCKKCGRKNAISKFNFECEIVYKCRWCGATKLVVLPGANDV